MKRERQLTNGITEGIIWKQLLYFFFPIVLGTFFQQLYNTVDAVIVGNFVGKEALAAVGGSTSTLINLLVGFFVGLSSGATVIISQFYGARKAKETSQAVHTAVALGLVGGVLFTVVGLLCSEWALNLMETPEEIMDQSLLYLRVYFGGIIFSLLYNVGAGILRAIGDSKRPLYFLIVCCIVNLVLDLLFVAVFHWGVFGAAFATTLSQVTSAVLVMVSLLRSTEMYGLAIKQIRFTASILKDMIRIGFPAGMQSVMYSVSNVIIQSCINTQGTDAVAAWTAFGKIDGIFWMIMGAFGVSITTFSGQNFGAQKYDRIKKSVRVCRLMAFAVSALISVILLFGGHYVMRLFTDDNAVIAYGMRMIRVVSPFYFTYVCIEVLAGAVRGAGDSLLPMLMTCIGVCLLRVVWVWTAVPYSNTIETVIFSYPLTWAITSVMFIIYYLQGGWLKRCIRKAGFPIPKKK